MSTYWAPWPGNMKATRRSVARESAGRTFVLEVEEVRLARPRLREDPEVGKVARRLSTLLE